MLNITKQTIDDLETNLNDFDPSIRAQALAELVQLSEKGVLPNAPESMVANMHCHTFYSYNAYGYSPSGLAWLAKRRGYRLMGIVDFDVLDGVEEFLLACDRIGIRGSTGIETRVFIPEFATREINSPGEPGVFYHMGIGFTSSAVPGPESKILNTMRQTAIQRNLGMVERLNSYLSPVIIDYDKDVLPLTPNGNATERHMLKAYLQVAENTVPDPVEFWSEKLNLPREKVTSLIKDSPAFQNTVRLKLMKFGGVGYVRPGPDTFPTVEEFHELVLKCEALPCATWNDGTSAGEQAMSELMDLLIGKGVVALNLIPDRIPSVADPEVRRHKANNLYKLIELTQKLDIPLNIGTEMNSFGQRLIDDFDAPDLQPVQQVFLDGAHFIYGNTVLQRYLSLGYQSEWAKMHLPSRKERNTFYTRIGYLTPPGTAGLDRLKKLVFPQTPEEILVTLEHAEMK